MSIRRYYTPEEVCVHNAASDCWVSIFHKVYDLTALIAEHRGPLTEPLIQAAGQDISHWFDAKTGGVKLAVDPARGIAVPYIPFGRFVHVPPVDPTSSWDTNFGTEWWRDDDVVIGKLSKKTRGVRVVNVLTQQDNRLTVCAEESLEEIRERYLEYNAHAASYTWKMLKAGKFLPMDMALTLEENGVVDESVEFEELGIDDDAFTPCIHLYFNDDLTLA